MFLKIIKKDPVLFAASLFAVISMFFVLPDKEYITYIDFRTIGLLFCLMSVVAGFSAMGLMQRAAEGILSCIKGTRMLVLVLWMICFFSSMLITNDVALITFVPLALAILTICNKKSLIIYTLVLQTIGANMGSMLTPVGNPQNLYLYGSFNIPIGEFFKITLPIIVISFILLVLATLFVKNESIEVESEKSSCDISYKKIAVYSILALLAIFSVLRFIDYRFTVIFTFICILVFDRKTIKSVDWLLLLTFCAFFIFVGNIERIDVIKGFIEGIISKSEFMTTLVLSQIISNVPAAVVLSGFTQNYSALVLGSDIGGLGTLIASLASLISFKFYTKSDGANTKRYIFIFSALNMLFLVVLVFFCLICQNLKV